MSVKLDLEITNLVKKFKDMPSEIQNAMIEELRLTGFMIESNYKIAVPVDTGRLQSSIHTETANKRTFNYSDSRGQTYSGKFSLDRLEKTQVAVGTNVIYAKKIEDKGGKTKGKDALETAFKKETAGLPARLAKLIK